MDSVTQLALGAAVGEAVLGKKIGARAALWGAAFGTLPDLDVLAKPFITEIQALAFHRGFSHSLLFVVIATPLFGWLLARLQPHTPTGYKTLFVSDPNVSQRGCWMFSSPAF